MSDRQNCEFCGSRLKTVGCVKCLGMMFLGSKYCGHCGAMACAARLLDDANAGLCPRCKTDLQTIMVDDVRIRECGRCGGFWSETQVFEDLCVNRERQASVLKFSGSYVHEMQHPPKVSYVPCPDCKELMNRSNFARSSGIIIDSCRQHGVWFDADELPKIIKFIDDGGLDRARDKEKIALQDERARLRDEQRRLAMMTRRSGNASIDEEKSRGWGGILSAFFD